MKLRKRILFWIFLIFKFTILIQQYTSGLRGVSIKSLESWKREAEVHANYWFNYKNVLS